jgi:DNA-binding PadR family transcriptional regulator
MSSMQESWDEGTYRLTDEQVEEIRRRRADKNSPRLTLEEFSEWLRRREAGRQG